MRFSAVLTHIWDFKFVFRAKQTISPVVSQSDLFALIVIRQKVIPENKKNQKFTFFRPFFFLNFAFFWVSSTLSDRRWRFSSR